MFNFIKKYFNRDKKKETPSSFGSLYESHPFGVATSSNKKPSTKKETKSKPSDDVPRINFDSPAPPHDNTLSNLLLLSIMASATDDAPLDSSPSHSHSHDNSCNHSHSDHSHSYDSSPSYDSYDGGGSCDVGGCGGCD